MVSVCCFTCHHFQYYKILFFFKCYKISGSRKHITHAHHLPSCLRPFVLQGISVTLILPLVWVLCILLSLGKACTVTMTLFLTPVKIYCRFWELWYSGSVWIPFSVVWLWNWGVCTTQFWFCCIAFQVTLLKAWQEQREFFIPFVLSKY